MPNIARMVGRSSGVGSVGRRLQGAGVAVAGAASLAVALGALVALADWHLLRSTLKGAGAAPVSVAAAFGTFAVAFVLRAVAWRRVLPGLSLAHAWSAIHVSLLGNHVLPLRLGEPLRVTSVVRRTDTRLDDAAASTVTLRAADTVAVALLAFVFAPRLMTGILGPWGWAVLAAVSGVGIYAWRWLRRLARADERGTVRSPDVIALGATIVAWAFEAVLVAQAASWAGLHLDPVEALAVTAVSVVAQIVAIAPGGIGTYEAAATAAYVALGFPPEAGLAAALAAHTAKTLYSLVVGGAALFVPRPGLLGRFRLPTPRVRVETVVGDPVAPDDPVVLVLPAHNEEATVAEVVGRVPATVAGRPVRCLVIDDGSTDGTAARASAAGATVISFGANRGLGAAVRVGLAEAVRIRAAAVAFCDADGEYSPEELERMVAPILDSEADYVVGSRFMSRSRRMRPHRRVGNAVLTAGLRVVARHPITDGQSGYRALSRRAASAAEIVHDYNYAQVLTLDLLAKGFRYAEVPISYQFRSAGRSFIRITTYLHHVPRAVWRELNAA